MIRFWQLRNLLPGVMIVAIVFDIGARLVPLTWLSYHTFEPALRQWHTAIGPFEPNRVIVKERAYGDLAALGNLPSFREYRRQEFHADQLGYRNAGNIDDGNYAGIVFGDSFAIAIDEQEELTLSGKLTKFSGARYYNAGPAIFPPSNEIVRIAARLRLSSGVAVVELLERRVRQSPQASGIETDSVPVLQPKVAFLQEVRRLVAIIWDIRSRFPSPGRILCQKLLKEAQNDVILPNLHAHRVARIMLNNHDEVLIYPEDLVQVGDVDALTSSWSSFLSSFRDRLAELNLKVVVLLVPNKYTVYAPFSSPSLNDPPGVHLLETLENKLRSAQVPVVNVTSAFRVETAKTLPQHEYLYWRDDTHWNGRAIEIASEQLWSEIQNSTPGTRKADALIYKPLPPEDPK